MTSPHERLGRAMEARRVELDLEWQEVAVAAKVSPATLRSIRSGTTNPSALTKRRVETALQWQHDSIDAILDGGEPTSAEAESPKTRSTVEEALARVAEMAQEIAEMEKRLREEQARHRDIG